jgi:trimeric autotransporter adhesin
MKKQILTIATVVMAAGVVTLASCKKEDTTAPTITVTGGSTQSQSLPATAGAGTWTDPTVTATDDEDGDLSTSVTVTGTVNPNLKGVYTLEFSVTDAAGNTATETVTVNIVNDAETFAGTYNVHDTVPLLAAFNYTQSVTASTTINNRIEFGTGLYGSNTVSYACYQNNTGIYATVTGSAVGSTVTLPSQTNSNIGTDNSTHTFSGNGSVTSASPFKFNITYTDFDVTNSSTANGCVQTYTKQ